MKTKCLSFHSRICPIERYLVYLVQENRFWTKSKQSVLNKTNSNSGTIPKRFGFISKTMSECLSFPFDIINLICRSISIDRFRTKKLGRFSLYRCRVGCGCFRIWFPVCVLLERVQIHPHAPAEQNRVLKISTICFFY